MALLSSPIFIFNNLGFIYVRHSPCLHQGSVGFRFSRTLAAKHPWTDKHSRQHTSNFGASDGELSPPLEHLLQHENLFGLVAEQTLRLETFQIGSGGLP